MCRAIETNKNRTGVSLFVEVEVWEFHHTHIFSLCVQIIPHTDIYMMPEVAVYVASDEKGVPEGGKKQHVTTRHLGCTCVTLDICGFIYAWGSFALARLTLSKQDVDIFSHQLARATCVITFFAGPCLIAVGVRVVWPTMICQLQHIWRNRTSLWNFLATCEQKYVDWTSSFYRHHLDFGRVGAYGCPLTASFVIFCIESGQVVAASILFTLGLPKENNFFNYTCKFSVILSCVISALFIMCIIRDIYDHIMSCSSIFYRRVGVSNIIS